VAAAIVTCAHENFEASQNVIRMTANSDNPDVFAFMLEVRVNCVDCGQPFGFKGLNAGVSYFSPRCSLDALEARIPLMTPTELALLDQPQQVPGEQEYESLKKNPPPLAP